jgi:excisionase family DNA binding protein
MRIEQYYTESEVCERLKISRKVLWRLRRDRQIDFLGTGRAIRYPESALTAYVERNTTRAREVRRAS